MSAATLSELDAALPGLTRKIRVLDALSWPDGVEFGQGSGTHG